MDDMENAAPTGGDEVGMSLDEAAAAFAKSMTEEAEPAKPEVEDQDEGEMTDDEVEAPDEEDEDESEDEDEAEGQAEDDEEEGEPESEGGRFVASNGRVRLPDGTIATVADLVQGNLRDRDYRQKTMSLAEERRAFEAQSSDFKASIQQLEQQRQLVSRLLEQSLPQQPNPEMLDSNSPYYDPDGYHRVKANYDQFLSKVQVLQQQDQWAKQQSAQSEQAEKAKLRDTEMKALVESRPDLKDPNKFRSFFDTIEKAGVDHGFTVEEMVGSIPYDRRMAVVLEKAAKWDKLQSAKPKAKEKVKGRPPIQKGGKRLSPNARNVQRTSDAVNRLKETGTVEDAAAAYIASLNK